MSEFYFVVDGFEDAVRQFRENVPVPEVKLEFAIPEKDFNTAGKGSSELKNLLKRLGVDSVILRRVAVASYEAEINVAAHSKGGMMYSSVYEDLVHVRFEDEGPGIADIDQAMTPGFSTADDLVRELGFGAGLGLPNIKKNSDAMRLVSAAGSPTKLEFLIYFA
ncbi:MAG: ATP-binding protein [Candidatus Cloacimonadaceae bacterium]|jgi:anti-sigma regulatory factor (Ser/Thr protein kinase)|nr:ATP-binding protein [Candidatus Cloacimonadota bacterium]MDY0126676.1 ATP-binding protein [Candidatus Cloacimonadaceae bacterium]MCB5255570.1 ATP-binding protein [Candidatus Cloacimonadota bacterium]MCK9177398.1 ATP-binding protein [Candidatus Cloacimonadota bacterium]MCK9241676.1 ATP-binding protein [Candidatus Cloacimonadota bacterium]